MPLLQSNSHDERKSRILIISQRQMVDQVANSCLYEFEDLIGDIDRVDLLTPRSSIYTSILEKISRMGIGYSKYKYIDLGIATSSLRSQFILEQDYDLLFIVVDNPWQLATIHSIENWQQKCRKVVCYIAEIWKKDIRDWRIIKDLLKFDWIFLAVNHCTEEIASLTGRPCTYLPPAVNGMSFCAYPNSCQRSIDICYIGRRSPITHRSLLDFASQQNLFYYYDTAKEMKIGNHQEHRSLLANIIKRSRYFLANYAKIDRFNETSGIQEIGYRFFEGVAGGTIMLGQPPNNEPFKQYFDWQDAIIPIPIDIDDIGEIISSLDRQPERLANISRNNTVNALLRHDWVYRWQIVLNCLEIPHTDKMLQRKTDLNNLATMNSLKLLEAELKSS